MKKAIKLPTIIATFLCLAAYSAYNTVRIQRLEARFNREPSSVQGALYALRPQLSTSDAKRRGNDTFLSYFGEAGVSEVEKAARIMQGLNPEPAPKTQESQSDLIAIPLGFDGREK